MANLVDQVVVRAYAGAGGSGCVSFRREKFIPKGGPNGGDGGNGADVILVAEPRMTTLLEFRHRRVFRGSHGGNGTGKDRHGRGRAPLRVRIPVGTIVTAIDEEGGERVLADLTAPGQELVVAQGGRGGRGNGHFATSTHQAPHFAERGYPGESVMLRLDLKLLADVGIIGFPNVGKSTLLGAMTRAHPKIGNYPFTTLSPNLGVVILNYDAFVVADIPGLIEGASQGLGLGHEFLRHIERTKVLLHVVDGESPHPIEDIHAINRELALFDASLPRKPQIIVVNKLDVPEVAARRLLLEMELAPLQRPVFFVSAAAGEGVPQLIAAVERALKEVEEAAEPAEDDADVGYHVFQPRPVGPRITVVQEDGTFAVTGPDAERIPQLTDFHDPAAVAWFRRYLARAGVARALNRAGARPGDHVKIGSLEFPWYGS